MQFSYWPRVNCGFLVIDASTVQSPGAIGTDYRVHLVIDLVRLHLVEVTVTNEHTGEHSESLCVAGR